MYCSSCGSSNPDPAKFCNSCGAALGVGAALSPGGGTPAAPAPPGNAAAVPGGWGIARLSTRAIAVVFDALLILVAVLPFLMKAAARWGTITDSGANLTGLPAILFMAAVVVVALVYFVVLEATFGATVGKFIFLLQVRGTDGGSAGIGAVVARNLLRLVDAIGVYLLGFLVAIFSKLRQRIGDHVAKTVVVEREWNKAVRLAWLVVWIAALVVGIWQTVVVHRAARAAAPAAVASTTSSGASTSTTSAGTGALVLTSGNLQLRFEWRQSPDGPVRPAAPYKPGDKVISHFEVTGYSTDAQGRIDVGLNVVALDPDGLGLDRPWTDTLRQSIGNNAPITGHYNFTLPLFVPAGTYKLVIKVHDAAKNTDVEFAPTFAVERSSPAAPSRALEVRNFIFSAAEDGVPLQPAVFQPGQTVHYRFELAGTGFAADRANVHIAFKLLSPSGEVLMDKPDWVTVGDQFSYHPATFYLPISGYLTLPSDAGKGTFTERFVVLDNNSNSTVTHEAKFEVQ